MESQPQNPEFRNNHENFHPCSCLAIIFLRKEKPQALIKTADVQASLDLLFACNKICFSCAVALI